MLRRLRPVLGYVPLAARRRQAARDALRRGAEVLLHEGLWALLLKTRQKIRQGWRGHGLLGIDPRRALNVQYEVWLRQHRLTADAVAELRAAAEAFTYRPLVSLVTPVYDPDETWLRKAIDSVLAQAYPRWELCLVNDASSAPHVASVLDGYAATDQRVRVKHLPRNEGIVGASTHALDLATGDFVGFLDHDDELSPDALFEVVKRLNEDPHLDLLYSDEDKLEADGRRVEPFFKPDWSPDLLLSMNYITHFSVFRRSLLRGLGGFRRGFDGSQDYDLILRVTERTSRIAHIPKVLYHWRKVPASAAGSATVKRFAYESGRQAVKDALLRRGYEGDVESTRPGRYAVRYRLRGTPLVSIIIPAVGPRQFLQRCLRSVRAKTSYTRYEIIVLDQDGAGADVGKNGSAVADRLRVCPYEGPLTMPAIRNLGAARSSGDYLLFLSGDTEVIRADWLVAMLEQAQRPEVGAVGARLLHPDGRARLAEGVSIRGEPGGAASEYAPDDLLRHFGFAELVCNCSAVSGSCMMVPRPAFEGVGGFDDRFAAALGDVDLCLRLLQRGRLIVYTPLARLLHRRPARGGRPCPPTDEALFRRLWGDFIRQGDPYCNPNLVLFRL